MPKRQTKTATMKLHTKFGAFSCVFLSSGKARYFAFFIRALKKYLLLTFTCAVCIHWSSIVYWVEIFIGRELFKKKRGLPVVSLMGVETGNKVCFFCWISWIQLDSKLKWFYCLIYTKFIHQWSTHHLMKQLKFAILLTGREI